MIKKQLRIERLIIPVSVNEKKEAERKAIKKGFDSLSAYIRNLILKDMA